MSAKRHCPWLQTQQPCYWLTKGKRIKVPNQQKVHMLRHLRGANCKKSQLPAAPEYRHRPAAPQRRSASLRHADRIRSGAAATAAGAQLLGGSSWDVFPPPSERPTERLNEQRASSESSRTTVSSLVTVSTLVSPRFRCVPRFDGCHWTAVARDSRLQVCGLDDVWYCGPVWDICATEMGKGTGVGRPRIVINPCFGTRIWNIFPRNGNRWSRNEFGPYLRSRYWDMLESRFGPLEMVPKRVLRSYVCKRSMFSWVPPMLSQNLSYEN